MDKKTKEKRSIVFLSIALVLVLAVLFVALGGAGLLGNLFSPGSEISLPSESAAANSDSSISGEPIVTNDYVAMPLPDEMRAMWISFLEWNARDIATEAAMRSATALMFDECKDLGLNTVIVHVRPFSDAFYKSEIYPWSSLLTGTQGQDPGFDPLQVIIDEAHARGLRIEAFINPYRVKNSATWPASYADNSPATLNPSWVRPVGENKAWFDPGIPEVQEMVVRGVQEIVANYDVDGIHFDDYFYPEEIDESFDAATYAQHGGGVPLAQWRVNNNNELVKQVYSTVKNINTSVSFGISPAGNNDNNMQKYFADVKKWMAEDGYIDYIMPQLYWGFNYRLANGSDRFAFKNILNEWLGYTRSDDVKFYVGLAPYRVLDGTDGGANAQDEWESGHNIADMIAHARTQEGCSGFALFRHDSVFAPEFRPAEIEAEAIKQLLA